MRKAGVSFILAISPTSMGVFLEGKMASELDRITRNPAVMGGKACIRGMRVTVGLILDLLASGKSADEILIDYPYLEADDIRQALRYAAWLSGEREEALNES